MKAFHNPRAGICPAWANIRLLPRKNNGTGTNSAHLFPISRKSLNLEQKLRSCSAKAPVSHIQDSALLEDGNGYSRKKVLRFFSNWTPGSVLGIGTSILLFSINVANNVLYSLPKLLLVTHRPDCKAQTSVFISSLDVAVTKKYSDGGLWIIRVQRRSPATNKIIHTRCITLFTPSSRQKNRPICKSFFFTRNQISIYKFTFSRRKHRCPFPRAVFDLRPLSQFGIPFIIC